MSVEDGWPIQAFSWLEWGSFMPFAAGHVKIPPFATKTKATRNLVVTCNRIVSDNLRSRHLSTGNSFRFAREPLVDCLIG